MAEEITVAQTTRIGNGGTIDNNHPYHLNNTDSPRMNLINSIFDGKGFSGWRRGVLIALSTKKKLGLINNACKAPDLAAVDYEIWAVELLQ